MACKLAADAGPLSPAVLAIICTICCWRRKNNTGIKYLVYLAIQRQTESKYRKSLTLIGFLYHKGNNYCIMTLAWPFHNQYNKKKICNQLQWTHFSLVCKSPLCMHLTEVNKVLTNYMTFHDFCYFYSIPWHGQAWIMKTRFPYHSKPLDSCTIKLCSSTTSFT